jgi:hypothetical protein
MTRTHTAALLVFAVAAPAAIAGSFKASNDAPCFIAGNTGYRMSGNASPNITVRIDNTAATPDLRVQLTDDVAAADFVLLDDGIAAGACPVGTAIQNVRLDPTAANPDLTVALSRAPAAYKIYVRSAGFSQQDAAALFAAIWRNAGKTAGSGREFAARN